MELEKVIAIENLRVSANPEATAGIACVMDFVFSGNRYARFGLPPEVLRQLVHALIDKMPPADRAMGRN